MNDHAAVKPEHGKLMAKITDILQKNYRVHDVPFGANDITQLLADFARDERLKEAERVKAVAREHMFDGDYSRFEEQLKRGELVSDCKTNHARLVRLEGPIHESGKDYRCEDCGDVFEVEVKPATIGVGYGEPGEKK